MLTKTLKEAKNTMLVTIVSIGMSSFSLSVIPFLPKNHFEGTSIFECIIAVMFWICLILSVVLSYTVKRKLKAYREILINEKAIKRQKCPGICSFSFDAKRIILYSVVFAGMIFILTDVVWNYVHQAIMFPIISITMFLFGLHCVIDGKYYKVYEYIKESTKNDKKHRV